ncbi:hypothetical protein TSUD_325520 [Trifolium subterraneum]|uniref:Reverse transcriptase zinc-binding domain-containing protein n=1 Tax=Trifolium subterraneum TaxID=3900 RepID=A0A2Z6M0Y8_TRISU|nr:hypothetical protein TSUD_325520 [Trifolium subterraneum]
MRKACYSLQREVHHPKDVPAKHKRVPSPQPEAMKVSFEDHHIHSLWGHKDVNWVAQESVGLSGVERDGVVFHLVNVYSPCSISGKRVGSGAWEGILMSCYIRRKEKAVPLIVDMEKEFYLITLWRRWRLLMSRCWWIGDRDIYDHCPICLTVTSNNWGPKPFRVINGWLEHPEFISFLEKSWKSFEVHGKKAYLLKEKFKLLKECLRKWNKEVYGYLHLNIEKTVKKLNDIEGMMGGDETELELTRRLGLNKEFWRQLNLKESLLKQKSRMWWVKEGDSNSRYFHEAIKSRRRNQLVALNDGDHWIQGVEEIKGFVKNYFENNFKERWEDRPNLNGIQFQALTDDDNTILTPPFSIEEVREAIWCSDSNKSPDPDGFNFNFLKACWEFIKDNGNYLTEKETNSLENKNSEGKKRRAGHHKKVNVCHHCKRAEHQKKDNACRHCRRARRHKKDNVLIRHTSDDFFWGK